MLETIVNSLILVAFVVFLGYLAGRRNLLKVADRGSTSMLDVRQAEQLVYTAAEQIPDLERQIEQQENSISILLGKNPAPVPRGRKLTEQPHAP